MIVETVVGRCDPKQACAFSQLQPFFQRRMYLHFDLATERQCSQGLYYSQILHLADMGRSLVLPAALSGLPDEDLEPGG